MLKMKKNVVLSGLKPNKCPNPVVETTGYTISPFQGDKARCHTAIPGKRAE